MATPDRESSPGSHYWPSITTITAKGRNSCLFAAVPIRQEVQRKEKNIKNKNKFKKERRLYIANLEHRFIYTERLPRQGKNDKFA